MKNAGWVSLVCVLIVSQVCSAANLIVNPGFELGSYQQPTVIDYGVWTGGDLAEFVNSTGGISPLDGSKMLKFISTGGTTCNTLQIIDVSSFSDLISSNSAIARATGFFNRVLGDDETDTLFMLRIYAFSGPISSIGGQMGNGTYLTRTNAILIH